MDRRLALFLLYIDTVMVMADYHGLSKRHSGLTLKFLLKFLVVTVL